VTPTCLELPQRRRRRWLISALCGGLALCTGACGPLTGPQSITLSERELAQRIEHEFPRNERVLEVLEVEISAPSLTLLPERNRIASRFNLVMRDRLFGSSQRGRIGFESSLRFEPADHSVRLSKVRVDELRLDDAGGAGATRSGRIPTAAPAQEPPRVPLQRIGNLLAEQLLEDYVVWRASPEQVDRLRRSGYQADAVTVTNAGIEISFRPLN
jgi:hypothetical protein